MLSKKRSFLFITILLMLSVVFSACSPGATSEPDQITVQLSWFHSAEFAGFYIADQLGYYEEENIAVNLVAGGPETDPVNEIATGEAHFGVVAGDSVIRAQENGKEIVALAAIFRKSPLVVMAMADSGIQKPEDLQGKTVGVISPTLDTTWDIQFMAMLNTLEIDPDTMTFVPNEFYHGADDLLSGKMEASSGNFSTNEPLQAEIDGDDLNLIYYSDYGIEFYNNLIVSLGTLVQENPDLVERFIEATLKGYQYAIEHPEEAVNETVKYDEGLDSSFQQAMMEAQIPLIDTGDAPIGSMDQAVWENTQQILLYQNIIETSVNVDTIYTNEFIEKAQ